MFNIRPSPVFDEDLNKKAESSPSIFLSTTPSITKASNYLAFNELDRKLEIGTKRLSLRLMDNRTSSHKTNSWQPRQPRLSKTAQATLFKFDDELQSIWLPLEEELNLNPFTSNSMIVDKQVESSQIIGTLNKNLE